MKVIILTWLTAAILCAQDAPVATPDARHQSEEALAIPLAIRERRKTDMIAFARSIPGNENLPRIENADRGYSSFHGGFYENSRR